jgi:hypothetical protein
MNCDFLKRTVLRRRRRKKYEKKKKKKTIPWAGKLKELSGGWEDDESNLSITQNRKLFSFLQKPSSSLGKGNLPRRHVVDLLDLDLLPRHILFIPPKIQTKPFTFSHPQKKKRKYAHKIAQDKVGIC